MKNLKSLFIASILAIGTIPAIAADEAVLMTIDGHEVTREEFEYIYRKNSANNAIDKKSLDEYLEMFKNFKLKVIEAELRGMDTLPQFVNELRGYRDQLAKPYLTDLSMEETLCREAYDHLQQDVEVSHVLIRLPENPTPADTLEAYTKAQKVAERLKKEDFGKVAAEMSDDPSVERNKGYLGFFTGGMLVYPFEKAMFQLEIGKISEPVRTFYGYHVIKVHSRRPAIGQVRVSHIMKMVKTDAPEEEQQKAWNEIVKIQERLASGEKFGDVARTSSDDRGSAARNGELSWFGVSRMVPEFEKAAFALTEPGQVSEPIRTTFGWHIIKLEERRGVESYEIKRPEILRQMQRDERATLGRTVLVDKLKKEYNFVEKTGAIENVIDYIKRHEIVDSTYFESMGELTEPFATFADVTLSQQELVFFIGIRTNEKTAAMVDFDRKVREFVEEMVLNYENLQLENKYPDFRYLMKEYHDGILLFNISNEEVWERASKDVAGLKQFFKENKKNYAWNEPHFKGFVLSCKDAETAKLAKKLVKKLPADSVQTFLKKRFNSDTLVVVRAERGLWKKGENAWVDQLVFGDKTADTQQIESLPVVEVVGKKLGKMPEDYTDVRGAVTADYQEALEQRWLETLRTKHVINVNQEVLQQIVE